MASGGHDSESRGEPQAGPTGASVDDGRDRVRRLLEEVLRRTLITPNPSESVTSDDMKALLEVRRRHEGQPLGLEPVAVDLVEAMLLSYFKTWARSPELWRAMSKDIARSLFENPVLRERLQSLWQRLAEASP